MTFVMRLILLYMRYRPDIGESRWYFEGRWSLIHAFFKNTLDNSALVLRILFKIWPPINVGRPLWAQPRVSDSTEGFKLDLSCRGTQVKEAVLKVSIPRHHFHSRKWKRCVWKGHQLTHFRKHQSTALAALRCFTSTFCQSKAYIFPHTHPGVT